MRTAAGLFVTGTDTGIGKTVASAVLVRALEADYWKPVQSGAEDELDAAVVQRLAGIGADRVRPSTYLLKAPLSPHEAARREGVDIALDAFSLSASERPVIVEGAGGVLVPLSERALMVDLMARLGLPVVLVARTSLGTINHSLLSLEALRGRGLRVAGVVLSGAPNEANRRAIALLGRVEILAELPCFSPLDAEAVKRAAALARPGLEAILHG